MRGGSSTIVVICQRSPLYVTYRIMELSWGPTPRAGTEMLVVVPYSGSTDPSPFSTSVRCRTVPRTGTSVTTSSQMPGRTSSCSTRPSLPEYLMAGLGSGLVAEGPVVLHVAVGLEVVRRVGLGLDHDLLVRVGQGDGGTTDEGGAVAGVRVDDAGLGRDGHHVGGDGRSRDVLDEGLLGRVDAHEDLRAVRQRERTREVDLVQVLVLVEVDVEVVEEREVSAAVGTEVVVRQVEDDGEAALGHQLGGDADDLRDVHVAGDLGQVAVDPLTGHGVAQRQELRRHAVRQERRLVAGAQVELLLLGDLVEEGVVVVVVRDGRHRNEVARGVQVVVVEDGPDAVALVALRLLDLVRVGGAVAQEDGATVTEEGRASELLVQLAAHLDLHPRHDVEVGDVDDVLTVELLALVDPRRSGRPAEHREDLVDLLVGLDVTPGPGLVRGDVRVRGLDAGERRVGGPGEELLHPVLPAVDELRGVHQRTSVREEDLDVADAVVVGVHQLLALRGANELTQRGGGVGAALALRALRDLQDRLDVVVLELLDGGAPAFLLGAVELVAAHVGSLRGVGVGELRLLGEGLGDCLLDDVVDVGVDCGDLVLGEGVQDLRDGGVALFRLVVRLRLLLGLVTLGVGVLDLATDDHHLVVVHVAVGEDVVDGRAGVGASENQAGLLDDSVVDQGLVVADALVQVLGPDRVLVEIPVLHGGPGVVRLGRTVQVRVTPDAVLLHGEDRVAEDLADVVVLVLVHQRDLLAVLVLEGTRSEER